MSVNASARQRVAVLFGGPSDEYDVSCHSAANVVRALNRDRFSVTPVRISRDSVWTVGEEIALEQGAAIDEAHLLHATRDGLCRTASSVGASVAAAIASLARMDVVLPVLHGRYGEDGTVQALLELAGVRYVGNGVFASAAGMDKQQTKRLLAADGLTVAEGVVLGPFDTPIDAATRARLGLPVFVKPARSGSSFGVTKVHRWSDLDAAVELARRSDSKVLVERAVPGREVDVAVLECADGTLIAGPPLEIVLPGSVDFFDYGAKYENDAVEFRIPAELDPSLTEQLHALAIQVFRILDCKGMLRVDFFLRPATDGSGGVVPVVNEVNTMPGMTAMSQFPQIWKAAGIDYSELLTILIDTALTAGR
ncbi:D-alanine--D-alanine ligase family protein [Paraburkholderia sp. 2C]